jgi:hypothetical protein
MTSTGKYIESLKSARESACRDLRIEDAYDAEKVIAAIPPWMWDTIIDAGFQQGVEHEREACEAIANDEASERARDAEELDRNGASHLEIRLERSAQMQARAIGNKIRGRR